jgi:uncharacterized protein YeaO (DUF488 family)
VAVRIVQLGTARAPGEGPRLGTVRRPPRGVPKERWAAEDWYDVWLPNLSPSAALMGWIHAAAPTDANWRAFERRYRKEMAGPGAIHLIAALATLSRSASFSVGCYCADESRCHRSILRELLAGVGAELASAGKRR